MKGKKTGKKQKWKVWGIAAILLICGFVACGKEQKPPNVPLQDLVVEYPLDNMSCFTAMEDGTVYQVNLEQVMEEESEYKLHRFNAMGEWEKSISLKDYDMVGALAVSEDGKYVYFTAQNMEYGIDLYLFSYSVEDGVITKLCDFTYFDQIKQLVVVGDVVYILGKSPNWQTQEPPNSGYTFSGERLVSYCVVTKEQTQLGFEFPISMAAGGDGTLVVLGYQEGDGYCLMKYDPAKDSMRVQGRFEDYKFDRFAVCNGGRDVIYDYTFNPRGLVLSDINNLSVEAELYPDAFTGFFGVLYTGGRIYCRQYSKGLISFPLDAVQRDNKKLSFLTREGGSLVAPYGCGYLMEKIELSDEKFTVKVLARDQDYDLCMVDSFDGNASNLRKNGVFYPLNDVPGIEEYFARCFPYVREAAVKEDGTIWMLPVQIDVPGILSREELLKENGLSLRSDMTWQEYEEMLFKTTKEQQGKIGINSGFLKRIFARQYFSNYHTLSGGLFEESVRALSNICTVECDYGTDEKDMIMEAITGLWRFDYAPGRAYYEEDGVFVGIPKLLASDKNIASCTFLAVNPDSKRREEALSYLADLVAYQMRSEDVPYFADGGTQNALDTALYKVYQDAEIVFAPDSDIYDTGFDEMLSGELSVVEYIKQTEPKLKMYWGE
ncbi:MAG: hypothetical protein K2N63_14205 [Lachnospiraceae bacterium]|nr:hypothetical protein [Lachnospiraceae bacterium]